MTTPVQTVQNAFFDSSQFDGDGSSSNPVRLRAAAGGAVTGAGTANKLAKWSAATVLADSRVSDDGNLITATGRMLVQADFTDGTAQHAALEVLSVGVGLSAFDGGVQSFQQSTYDTTLAAVQSIGVYAGNSATRSAGANPLTNYGLFATAAGGQDNVGVMVNDGSLFALHDCALATSSGGVTIGIGAIAAAGETRFHTKLLVDSTQEVSLGDNVDGFYVPGSNVVNPQIGIGVNTSLGTQLNLKNTVPGIAAAGIWTGLDTTVEATIRGGYVVSYGAGGGFGGNTSGMWLGTGPMAGLGATDLSVFAQNGGRLCLGADGVGFTMGASLNAAGLFAARSVQVGDPVANTGYRLTRGNGAPVAAGVTIGDEYTDETGVLGTIKYVWNGAVWTAYA